MPTCDGDAGALLLYKITINNQKLFGGKSDIVLESNDTNLDDNPKGARKQGTPRCLLRLNACSMSFASD